MEKKRKKRRKENRRKRARKYKKREGTVPKSNGGGGESGHGIEAFTDDFKNFVNSSNINNILDITSEEQFLFRSKFFSEIR